jgi:hypothetical protein
MEKLLGHLKEAQAAGGLRKRGQVRFSPTCLFARAASGVIVTVGAPKASGYARGVSETAGVGKKSNLTPFPEQEI